MDVFLGILTCIHSVGWGDYLFEFFVITPLIGKYNVAYIMGVLQFPGMKSMTYANDKTQNSIGGNNKMIKKKCKLLFSTLRSHLRS